MQLAKAAAAVINKQYEPKPEEKTADGMHFVEELEINDYPQQARFKATHKDNMRQVIELYGTAITTRGAYFAPGRNPGYSTFEISFLVSLLVA